MKEYENEEDFLKDYNPKDYPSIACTTDVLVFGISSLDSSNYKKLDDKKMSVLLVKRDTYPFKDKWCLPGGFVLENETLDEAPIKVLKNETGISNIYLEQLYTFGGVDRDPRMRVISVSYMALIDKDKVTENLSSNSSWFDIIDISQDDNIVKITLSNNEETIDFAIEKHLKELTTDRYSFKILENKYMAFDHPLVILSGIERLKNKIEYTDIVFNMMPEYFTLGELQRVYEVILRKKLLDPAFRRIIANKVIPTDKYKTGEGHRPSRLFKYNGK